ncbi:hypothetical protein AB0I35_27525 [Nocardia sp. NPDC050378]|uniref:hypothetical protein n=1 Tax=Nocardia sp. NPDC050378 TaxID=3155400 RepID=UPI0033D56862
MNANERRPTSEGQGMGRNRRSNDPRRATPTGLQLIRGANRWVLAIHLEGGGGPVCGSVGEPLDCVPERAQAAAVASAEFFTRRRLTVEWLGADANSWLGTVTGSEPGLS